MKNQEATPIDKANRRLVKRLLLIIMAMFGFGFVTVPIHDMSCKATDLNGKTSDHAAAVESAVGNSYLV
jgi:cytochrome c oxidase assembly protein subunit 11